MSFFDQWQPVQGLRNAKILVYGPSGTGKTRFAATWPKPIFLDYDKGMASIQSPVARVRDSDLENPQTIQGVYEKLLPLAGDKFETLVLDGLREMQNQLLRYVIRQYPQKRTYGDQPSQPDFGKALNDFDRILRLLLSLPMHVVITSHGTERVTDTDVVHPMLIGKNTAAMVCAMVDIIGYTQVVQNNEGKTQHQMVFALPFHVAKDRTGKLPPVMASPSYEKILRAVVDTSDKKELASVVR